MNRATTYSSNPANLFSFSARTTVGQFFSGQRFAPLSDLYLVYNDNYITSDFGPRFRSINLKVTYWLNI